MIIVTAYGEDYQCSKAIKGEDYIKLYNDKEMCIVSFEGISNFDGYEINGGEWEIIQDA